MVRTRASNAAVRKAVVAKAPRKNVVSGSSVISPGGASGKRKGKAGGGGNPLKLWPVPKGQKGLQGFLGLSSGGSESESSGSSSSSSSKAITNSQQFEESGEEEMIEASSTEEGSSSSCCVEEGAGTPPSSLDDITQLNSDSEED